MKCVCVRGYNGKGSLQRVYSEALNYKFKDFRRKTIFRFKINILLAFLLVCAGLYGKGPFCRKILLRCDYYVMGDVKL